MSGAQMDPHDKMRARDVSKVARGEQAPRPAHEFGTVSPPPPPSSTNNDKVIKLYLYILILTYLAIYVDDIHFHIYLQIVHKLKPIVRKYFINLYYFKKIGLFYKKNI